MIPFTFKDFFFVVLFVVLSLCAQDSFSQTRSDIPISTDTVYSATDTFYHCIQAYYDTLTSGQIQEFQEDGKKDWLRYMPSVGLAYTPTGAPRPGVSIGSALIYTSYKDKQRKRNTIKGIQVQNQLAADTEILRFHNLIQKLQLMQLSLAAATQIFEIDQELFDFYTKQYESQELAPSAYLLKKKDYYKKVEDLRKLKLGIELRKLEIREAGRCG